MKRKIEADYQPKTVTELTNAVFDIWKKFVTPHKCQQMISGIFPILRKIVEREGAAVHDY